MSTDVDRLLQDALAMMKGDVRGAIAKLESAYEKAENVPSVAAPIAEELSRAYGRRKSKARSLAFARRATTLAPERKVSWTTLGKTCELIAVKTDPSRNPRRARALFRAAAAAFKKAASMAKDAEDRRWLLELAGDAAQQAR